MRVWIIETLPDYEQGNREGMFTSPHAAWGPLFETLDDRVFPLTSFEIRAWQHTSHDEKDIVLDFVYNSNDRVRLIGAYVKGTGSPKSTSAEVQELQEVAAIAAKHAIDIEDFAKTTVLPWDVRRTDQPTVVWRFAKSDN